MDSLKTGTILHGKSYDYKIIRTLGQGTFGITYLASVKLTGALGSIDSEIFVAVKEFFMRDLNGRNESSVTYSSKDGMFGYYKSRFIYEAKNLSNLHDPGIIKVMELFEENHTAYYVMEFVSHGSLDNHIKSNGQLSSAESVAYAIQIAKALGYMHRNSMLHLDLKPNNIMIKENNEIVLIDFGLSKRFDACGNPETSTTIGYGTPGYTPIEQASYKAEKGSGFPVTMDIYALGATMFKMLTGHRPPEALIILNDGFPFAELRNCGVPESIVEFVAKCMEPQTKNRYKSIEEIIGVLNAIETHVEGLGSEISSKAYYKKKHGEREYGTFYIENVPVTSSIDFPESIHIRLWDNSKNGRSYEVRMSDNYSFQNQVTIWDGGNLIHKKNYGPGIPENVKKFIISHGFLSTEHWENESGTAPIADDFGTDASITMVSKSGMRFVRRVSHAHLAYHNLLLDELLELLNSTSLAKLVPDKWRPRLDPPGPTLELIYSIPDSTSEIRIDYSEGGVVGLSFAYIRLRITNNKKSNCNEEDYIYSPEELLRLIKGLRQMRLKSQYEKETEPPTGQIFPRLTLSLYDVNGNLLKKIYAEDDYNEMIGNVAISVDNFKTELAKVCKSFRDKLTGVDKNEDTLYC